MSVDRSVFQALESAVAGMHPTDSSAVPVRLHLAGLYLSAGLAELALAHSMTVLAIAPQDTVALSLAAAAASAAGKDDLADSYRLLHAALLNGDLISGVPVSGPAVPEATSTAPTHPAPTSTSPTASSTANPPKTIVPHPTSPEPTPPSGSPPTGPPPLGPPQAGPPPAPTGADLFVPPYRPETGPARPGSTPARPENAPPRPEGIPPRPESAPARPQGIPPRPESAPPRPEPVRDPGGWDTADPRAVTLDDVAGMQDVKRRLHRSLLGPMANPTLSEAFGKQLRGGLLLWGPPGTGKTFIARALSGELGARFFSATPADIYGSFFGQSEQNVARLFAEARRESPGVVFLDELDAIGGRRSRRNTDQARAVVNQLLTELDGLSSNEGLYVLAATNAPWDVDDALRRPGRFDRTILVLPPDEPARDALLRMELAGRPVAPGVDVSRLVGATDTYSGADLVRVVEAATERALERSMELGTVSPVTDGDLQAAVRDTPASTRGWLNTAATYLAHVGDGEDFHELRGYLRSHKIG